MRTLKLALCCVATLGLAACGFDTGVDSTEDAGNRQEALAGPSLLHVIGITNSGDIFHALRSGSTWSGFGNVQSVVGRVGTFTRAAAAMSRAGLQVVGVDNTTGKLFHTIRFTGGNWANWGDVSSVIGNLGTHTSVALAESNTEDGFYLCTTTSNGKAWLSFRNGTTGAWTQVQDLKAVTNSNPGTFTNISCQTEATGPTQQRLHVMATTSDGKLWHALRSTSNTWSAFGNASAATGSSAAFADVDAVTDTSLNLQVVGTGSGFQFHTARFKSDGSWSAFGDIAGVATDPGSERRGAAALMEDGVHVFVTTSTGGLFRALRRPDSSWQAYSDVRAETGSSGLVFVDVAVAGGVPADITSFTASGFQTPEYVVGVKGKSFRPMSTVQFFYDNPVAGPIHFMNVTTNADGTINHQDTTVGRRRCSPLQLQNTSQFIPQSIRAVGPDGETVSFTTSALSSACF